MPVRIKLSRKVDVAPGIVNYELAVSDEPSSEGRKPQSGKPQSRKPKIDAAFAQSFSERLTREASRIAGFASKPD